MATLEKIRSKSVLLLVVIGVALLAFIIGDFFTSGQAFFSGTTVAKVGSQKIDIQEFQREMERANQQYQQSGQQIESAMLQQQVLEGMISERLFKEELEKLGIVVTNAEITEMMVGKGSAQLDALVQQQVGAGSAKELHDMAFNPQKYGVAQETAKQLQEYWLSLEQQTEQMLLQGKFNALFAGTLQANELDAKAIYDENNTTARVAYARKLYSSLPDDDAKYEVTDADIENEWSANKSRYALKEPMRTIEYINVRIAPSREDIVAGEKSVEEALAALKEKSGLEGIAEMPEFVANRSKMAVSKIRDMRIKSFVDSAKVDGVQVVSHTGNDFTLAKLFNRTTEVDSTNIDVIFVEGGKATVDSVLTALRGGMTIDSLGNKFSSVRGAQPDLWISLIDPSVATIKEAVTNATIGNYFVTDTANTQGAQILRVNSRKAPVTIADYAVIDYTTEPSVATVNNLQAKLHEYVTANKDLTSFVEKAQEAGYQVFPARITPSTPGLTGVSESRDVIAWAMQADKGDVSGIFGGEANGHFVAAALRGVYSDYIPANDTQVKNTLTAEVRNNKKAAELIAQYTGKAQDLEGYAKLMETKVDTTSVTFGQISLFNPGFAGPKAAALASVAEKGKVSAPLQGNTGVVVMQVVDVENGTRPYDFKESAALFDRVRGAQALSSQFNNLLLGNKNVENKILDFFKN